MFSGLKNWFALIKLANSLPKRLDTADLNKESANAAGYYLKNQMGSGVPLDVQQNVLNYVASGFYMGYRKAEEKYGITGTN